ncbi:polyprenyl synthetase family protein [Streptomyces sp. NPDC058757]|uniref:polyprenyl synthetase family protein n=1 Tax=unclassified Streptomyces TaxID=2593676 RepID=UPI00368FBDCC
MRTLDPQTVDRDVPAALDLVLDDLLARRLDEARALEGTFASDIAARVAAFTLAGGRRRRSQLLWWSLRACGGGAAETGAALRAAAAVELIQTCALVHDDVMDGSPLRRAAPALHAALDEQYGTAGRRLPLLSFGGAAAVLAGDLALAWADDAFAEVLPRSPYADGLAAEWRAMRTGMVAGQYLDLHAQATGVRSPGRALRTAVLKTARYSAVHPLVLGARLAGASERTLGALRRAGSCAGVAFQLRDDLEGVFGDPARTGKPAGEDLRDGKATCLLAVGRALCVRQGDTEGVRLLDDVVGSPDATDEDLRRVTALLAHRGARAYVTARLEGLSARAARTVRSAGLAPGPAERVVDLLLDAAGVAAPPATDRAGTGGEPVRPGVPAVAGGVR